MRFLKFLFFSIITPLVYSEECPNSYCTDKFSPIRYPFKLETERPKKCSDYINLKCSQNNAIVNLPFSGDFYVRQIIYYTKTIYLYNPDCLPQRLMNLSLTSTPFYAIDHQDYTFYNCPTSLRFYQEGFTPIACLSNYPNATVAISSWGSWSPETMIRSYGCSIITTANLPISNVGQYDQFSDLQLRWNVPYCRDCDKYGPKARSKQFKFVKSSVFIPLVVIFGIIFTISCFAWLMKCTTPRNQENATTTTSITTGALVGIMMPQSAATTTVSPPQPTSGATTVTIDESKFKFYTMSTCVEENLSTVTIGPHQVITCTICLEEYSTQNTIKCIISCQHYFHADCIDLWCEKNSTCPVCRTSLLD